MAERDRPAAFENEIEVTPKTIKAGMAAYCAVDPRVADPEFLVTEIYRAMAGSRGCRLLGRLGDQSEGGEH